jgi:hypothetical protein
MNVEPGSPEWFQQAKVNAQTLESEIESLCGHISQNTYTEFWALTRVISGMFKTLKPLLGEDRERLCSTFTTACEEVKAKQKEGRSRSRRLGNWLWEAACVIQGPLDAPKFQDYILPLLLLKRLSDVFDDEIRHLAQECGDEATAAERVEKDHKLVRVFIPQEARWANVAKQTEGIGQFLTDAVRAVSRENSRLTGVFDVIDFNATMAGQRIVDDGRLASLVQILSNPHYRLGLKDVEPDILVQAHLCLLRKCAEVRGITKVMEEGSEAFQYRQRIYQEHLAGGAETQ